MKQRGWREEGIPKPDKKSRFSEIEILAILMELEACLKVSDFCRKHCSRQPSHYIWERKYGGLEVAELRRN
ncbi:MAG: hypothetical protein RL088_602 [Verrucomicrobiota bacterium]|jgi:putative transposase